MSNTERLQDKLKHLRLTAMLHHLETTLEQATAKNLDVISTLNLLADIEIEQRWQRAGHAEQRPLKCCRLGQCAAGRCCCSWSAFGLSVAGFSPF